MGYFDKEKEQEGKNKIFLSIIIALMVIDLLAFKAILSIASNKTIVIQVPQFLKSGKYVIGNTFANNNVYKMWGRIWIQEIANFSYEDIRKRTQDIFPYLNPQTAFNNKGKILKFVQFVEDNFITQKFELQNIFITNLKNGYKEITAEGIIKRKIGKEPDKLNGMPYSYQIIAFVRNGQIYINSIKSFITNPTEPLNKKKLEKIKTVNYTPLIEEAEFDHKDSRALIKAQIKRQEKIRKEKKAKKLKLIKLRVEQLKKEQGV